MRNFRQLPAMPALLALAGCTASLEPPRIVRVPVPVACVPAQKLPDPPRLDAAALDGNAVHDLDLVAAHALRLRAWGDALHAALLECSKLAPEQG